MIVVTVIIVVIVGSGIVLFLYANIIYAPMRTIEWSKNNTVIMVDQTLLPGEYKVIECTHLPQLCEAISMLRVRGAPALGASGGFGIALAAVRSSAKTMDDLIRDLEVAAITIIKTRPTAINLSWGVARVMGAVKEAYDVEGIRNIAILEAQQIADEDVERNKRLGAHGAKLLNDGDTVMTHCNAGKMACVDWGTALGVIRSAVEAGKDIKVISCETRPLNQGSRITSWEMMEDNIPVTLITDSMAGMCMRKGMIDSVVVGADRITQDAVFNKIGTYSHAVMAKEHEIPFYVAAPVSTFDFERFEEEIVIEERDPDEIRYFHGIQNAPLDVNVFNPAFDATPMEYVTALITEKGTYEPPFLIGELKY